LSGLKYNYADAVQATLGSPYPFVRRNGAQKYRTFNIGGMISYTENGADKFLSDAEIEKYALAAPSAQTQQYLLERIFREKVLQFLHKGNVKLLKSLQEGLMLVRLTNISLTSEK
jgi:hypothetical protein